MTSVTSLWTIHSGVGLRDPCGTLPTENIQWNLAYQLMAIIRDSVLQKLKAYRPLRIGADIWCRACKASFTWVECGKWEQVQLLEHPVAGFTSFPMSLFYLEIVRFEWGSGELRELGTKNGNTRIIQVLIPVWDSDYMWQWSLASWKGYEYRWAHCPEVYNFQELSISMENCKGWGWYKRNV